MGGMAKETTTFFKCLADQLADKWKESYSTIMGWLHCRVSFALLHSAICAIRGTRSGVVVPVPVDFSLVAAEGNLHQ